MAGKRRFGHELPLRPAKGAAALRPITDTRADDRRGRDGPKPAARTRSKNSEDRPEGRHRPTDWGVIFFPTLQRA
jgi:hypothetical protein